VMDNTDLALTLGKKIDEGFSALHSKIDMKIEGLRKELIDHQVRCGERFQRVETEVRVKTAIADVIAAGKEAEEKKRIWPKVQIALTISTSIAVLAAAAKVLLAHTPLFLGG